MLTRHATLMKVYFPIDFLRGKDKRRYAKASKVVSYNIYEQDINNIPKLDEAPKTSLFFNSILKFYTKEELANYFGVSMEDFVSILNQYNIGKS